MSRNLKCTRSILPPCPHMGCGVVERHLETAQPTKKLLNSVTPPTKGVFDFEGKFCWFSF